MKCTRVKVTHRIDDAAQSLKNEHRCPVVIQVVPLCSLYAHRHEGFGFRLSTYEQHNNTYNVDVLRKNCYKHLNASVEPQLTIRCG